MTDATTIREQRTSEQGNTFDVEAIRGFLARVLGEDLLAEEVNDLLFAHVVEGRYHRSVLAASLRPIIDEVLNITTREDWEEVADTLIAETRILDGAAPLDE